MFPTNRAQRWQKGAGTKVPPGTSASFPRRREPSHHAHLTGFPPAWERLVTLWGGPILGVMIPAAIAFVIRTRWIWFVAYFCMLANGLYIATAWVSGDRFLDTPKMLEHGAHPISIAVYCLLTIGFGYVGFRRYCTFVPSETPTDSNSTE